jgi:hypothetical protein
MAFKDYGKHILLDRESSSIATRLPKKHEILENGFGNRTRDRESLWKPDL